MLILTQVFKQSVQCKNTLVQCWSFLHPQWFRIFSQDLTSRHINQMKLWDQHVRLSCSNILCDLNNLNREYRSSFISKLPKFIRSCCSVLRAWHIVVCQLMLIGHWDPSNPVNSWAFPFIHDYIESVMSIGTCWLKQIVNFFIDNLNISNFDRIWKITWRSISASMLLLIRSNLLYISYPRVHWKHCQKSKRQVQDRFCFLPCNEFYQILLLQNWRQTH